MDKQNNAQPKKKKGKAGKIILIIVAILLVLSILGAVVVGTLVVIGLAVGGGALFFFLDREEGGLILTPNEESVYEETLDQSFESSYYEEAERAIESIAVTATPYRTEYFVGNSFKPDGMAVTAYYTDGTEVDITSAVEVNPTLFTKSGSQQVTVSFEGFNASFTVNVEAEGIRWTLDDGVLTVWGNTDMPDYTYYSTSDWKASGKAVKELVVEKGVTSIGAFAFAECVNLEKATLPEGLKTIGESAFNNCEALESINLPKGLKTINSWAFGGCNSLEVIEVPASVSSIKEFAFSPCDNLTAINVDEDSDYYSSHYGVLLDKKQTKLIQYPENKENIKYAVPSTVKTICNASFYQCNRLEEVNFGANVTVIEDYAFYESAYLSRVNFDGTLSDWANVSLGVDWRYGTDISVIYCNDGESNIYGIGGGYNFYKTSSAGTNYAFNATYSVRTDGFDTPNYIAGYEDYGFTLLNNDKICRVDTFDANSAGGYQGVTVMYAGTNRVSEFTFKLDDYYGDLSKLVFYNVRDGIEYMNNRGFKLIKVQVSDDGYDWTTVNGTLTKREVEGATAMYSANNNSYNVEHFNYTYTFNNEAKGKYVRVFLSPSNGYVLQFDELGIFNS